VGGEGARARRGVTMARPRTAAFLAMSLDGFIAKPDGGLDWLERSAGSGEDHGYSAFFAGIDTLVVGRATWEVVGGFREWPYGAKRVVVLTHRPAVGTHGERFLAGSPAELLATLERDGAQAIYVDGGATVSSFLAAGLLDELTISVIPIVLGDGIRLFPGRDQPERELRLVASRTFASGLVQLRYVPR
jgi:dihydrofolate reductase